MTRPLQTAQVEVPPGMIDLGVGQPGFDLLPLAMLRQAAEHRLSQGEPALLQYGLEQGDAYFRRALARFLSARYGTAVSSEALFVTNGVSQALDLVCTLFTRPGDLIFVEEPTYFLALRIFADHHLRVESIPIDEQGLIPEVLESRLAVERPIFLYTIPTFQNPTGVTLSSERREQLVQLSRQHRFLLVADEVYHLLNYAAVPPLPLAHYLEMETVLSLGSFSKILAPGLRLGWIQAAPVLLDRLVGSGLLESGGGLDPFTAGIIRSALEAGWQETHLQRLKVTYQGRAAALSRALRQHLPAATFSEPKGGFFVWLKLLQTLDTAAFLTAARAHQVGFQPGVKFSAQQGLNQYLRLSFSFYDKPTLAEGVVRLQRALAAA